MIVRDVNSPASLIHSSYSRTALEVSVLKAMSVGLASPLLKNTID